MSYNMNTTRKKGCHTMFEAGLVLEGGAERGVFTAGALDYLMERGIEFSYVCGASAGACNGVDFVSKQIGRSKAAFIPKDPSYRMAKLSAIPSQHALIDMDMLFDAFPNDLIPFDYDTYFASPVRCEMVVTNAVSGEAEYRDDRTDRKRFMDICRASSSIPVFARMVDLDGTPYVDGGVGDSIPLVHSMKLGYRKNFVILTQKDGYRKKPAGRALEALYRSCFRKYPNLVRALLNRHLVYNRELDLLKKWEEEGRVFVLRPKEGVVGRLESDPKILETFYQHGYDLMKERESDLLAYLER